MAKQQFKTHLRTTEISDNQQSTFVNIFFSILEYDLDSATIYVVFYSTRTPPLCVGAETPWRRCAHQDLAAPISSFGAAEIRDGVG